MNSERTDDALSEFSKYYAENKSIVFVTDEIFLPEHNGSSRVYANLARSYREQGYHVYAICFCKGLSPEQPNVQRSYQNQFDGHLFLPNWSGGPVPEQLNLLTRELRSWTTGNIFAPPLYWEKQSLSISMLAVDFIRRHGIQIVYFHKVQTLVLLKEAIQALLVEPGVSQIRSSTRLIVDLHDDFVMRAKHYQQAYHNVFQAMNLKDKVKLHPKAFLRATFAKVDENLSREYEIKLLQKCDQILVASNAEFERYSSFPELEGKVHHKPWPFTVAPSSRSHRIVAPEFHGGIIGSEDVMNLDGFLFFQEKILPWIREKRPEFRLLLAGTITQKVSPLIRNKHGIVIWPKLDRIEAFYEAIGVSIVPLRYGTGVSIKVLEALEYGCPVVSTTVGVRGLPKDSLPQVHVTDDANGFAAAVVAFS